jgi:hypothetical protein
MVSLKARVRLESRCVHILPLNYLAEVPMRVRDRAAAIATVKRWQARRQAGDTAESVGSTHIRCAAVIVLASSMMTFIGPTPREPVLCKRREPTSMPQHRSTIEQPSIPVEGDV